MNYRGYQKYTGKTRLMLAALFVLVGILFIVFRSCGMRFSGFLCLGIAVLLVLSVLLGRMSRRSNFWRGVKGVFYACIVIGVACFGVLEFQVLRAGHSETKPADAAIVLGAGVNGTRPSLTLKSRLDAAVDYAAENPGIPIVLSGGKGYGENITEAECMRRYLTEHGVDENRLLLEEAATNTAENFSFSKNILEQHGYETAEITVAVISNDFHLCRAELLAKREGLRVTGVGMPIPWLHLEINYTIREAFALVKTYLF